MIDNLMLTLPVHRHGELKVQLGLLEREYRKHFSFAEDLALAAVADVQGLGGHSISAR